VSNIFFAFKPIILYKLLENIDTPVPLLLNTRLGRKYYLNWTSPSK
jgi:hypothetical protein